MDVKSGGTGYNFAMHIMREWRPITGPTLLHPAGTSNEMPLFENTGVPTKELHAYLRGDWNVYGFLHKFPTVSMEQALAELERDAREKTKRIIERNEEIADGALVFERTDVPVKLMFEYLADLKSLKDFHWDFPAVFRSDAYDAVDTSRRILEIDAYRGVENGVFHSDTRIVSGAPIFVGSRMPIKNVFDYLSHGETLKDFFYDHDTGVKKHLAPVVHLAGEALERTFNAAVAR